MSSNSSHRAGRPVLRDYQTNAVSRVLDAIEAGKKRILLVAPTGAGKTVLAAALVDNALRKQKRVLFLAHRRELIKQASNKLHATGIDHGILLPGYGPRPEEPVQVASIATLHARAFQSRRMDLPEADLVIVDEAHHCRARTYTKILEAYPQAVVIGLTATPCRGDGRGLGNVFEMMIECPSVAELIEGGFLVGTKVYAPYRPDLKGVKVERGDYVESQLAARMDTGRLVGDIVTHWLRLGERRQTVVFATGVAHSVHIRDEFRRAGVMAEHIDGKTPSEERDRILADLSAGRIDLVTNAMVLTEGWDQPSVSCLVLARPTKSLGLFRQMIGRVLRPAPRKMEALVLDHAGATFTHGFAEDAIEWELSEDRKAENKAHASRGGSAEAPGLTTCPECTAVRMEGKPCGACGWRPQSKAQSIEIDDGDLARVERDRSVRPNTYDDKYKGEFHGQLIWIGQEKGYGRSERWAACKYKEKFGVWPPSWTPPPPKRPTQEVRSWVHSRVIAWARSQDAARRAGGR
jgi:DNA repair protein RadD